MTRIISGKLRGKKIIAPTKLPVRPTTDFAKEGLFNVLNNQFYFDEIKALDLFSGLGNLSYELASRGCSNIVAVDKSTHCLRFIEQTAEKLKLDAIKPVRSDALDFIKKDFREYDLIIADPPYNFERYDELIEQVFFRNLLNEGGLFVLEHDPYHDFSDNEYFKEERKYGKVHFSFFKNRED